MFTVYYFFCLISQCWHPNLPNIKNIVEHLHIRCSCYCRTQTLANCISTFYTFANLLKDSPHKWCLFIVNDHVRVMVFICADTVMPITSRCMIAPMTLF